MNRRTKWMANTKRHIEQLQAELKVANEQIGRFLLSIKPTEFTKECREMIKTPDDDKGWTQLAGYVIWLEIKLEQACKIIDDRVNVCPNCGDSDIEIFVAAENFGTQEIFVPIYSCKKCSFKWTDDIAGTVWDKNNTLFKAKDEQIQNLTETLLRIDNYCRVNDIDLEQAMEG